MRFITEFELKNEDFSGPWISSLLSGRKHEAALKLGNDIVNNIEWTNLGGINYAKYKIEIEAFPMDKWVEFKEKIVLYVHDLHHAGKPTDPIRILSIIEELESFGKPSGDAINNQQTSKGGE